MKKDIDDKSFMRGLYTGSIVTLVVTLGAMSIIDSTKFLRQKDVNRINELYSYIEKEYYEDVDRDEVLDAMYHSLFDSLDKYSGYYNKEELIELQTENDDFVGVGIYVTQRAYDNRCKISKVYTDSPAEKAGLQNGDIILEVDNTDIMNLSVEEITELIRGKKGTEVTFKVMRGDDTLEFTAIRDNIKTVQLFAEQLNSDTGYIQILSFGGTLSQDFEVELNKMRKAGTKNIIIDLRNNGGGYVGDLLSVLNQIAPNNTLVTYTLNNKGKKTEYKTENNITELEFNYVILTNESTASCSEIFTGMFQDYGWATVIGEKTYGKGVVQTLVTLKDTAYKLTTDRYYTPNGVCIDGQGITPDIIIKDTYTGNNLSEDSLIIKALEIFQ